MTFYLMFVCCCFFHIIFSFVCAAEWTPFGKELPTWLTICSLCILTICNFSYFPFGFEGGILLLIVPVPGHCILVTFFSKGKSENSGFFRNNCSL